MGAIWPQLTLIGILILINAVFAGTELALVSLREGQLQRLEAGGGSGVLLNRLARDPNRFLATIQIVITLAGFFASASAAVTLAQPLEPFLSIFGEAANVIAIVLVTILTSYVMLVFGELAPKRIAMQRAEKWGLVMARPLAGIAVVTKPVVWLLSRSSDLVVRLLGGDPSQHGEEITTEEIRELLVSHSAMTAHQRIIVSGAFEISERTLREIVLPRRDVVVLDNTMTSEEGVRILLEAGHSRAPVAVDSDLDNVVGVVHLRDLISATGTVGGAAKPPLVFPETLRALAALRQMQQSRQHMAIVISEHGAGEGIVTIEDLIEEVVGEIYDESDRDILSVERKPDGSFVLPGRFPVHDLVDLGIDLPEGDYTTIAGLVLDALGRLPQEPGDKVLIDGWEATVQGVKDRAITHVGLRRTSNDGVGSERT